MDPQITAIADPLRAWIVKKKSTLGPIAGAVALLWIIARLQAHIAARSNSSKLPSPKFALPYFGKSRHIYFWPLLYQRSCHIGHLFHLGSNPIKTFSQWHQKYGLYARYAEWTYQLTNRCGFKDRLSLSKQVSNKWWALLIPLLHMKCLGPRVVWLPTGLTTSLWPRFTAGMEGL